MFCNIWLVFIALALNVRQKEHIALNFLYTLLPHAAGFAVQLFWTAVFFIVGAFICWYGYEVAVQNPNRLWEFGYMRKTYPLIIMPICGLLICIAAVVAAVEDVILFRAGKFRAAGDMTE